MSISTVEFGVRNHLSSYVKVQKDNCDYLLTFKTSAQKVDGNRLQKLKDLIYLDPIVQNILPPVIFLFKANKDVNFNFSILPLEVINLIASNLFNINLITYGEQLPSRRIQMSILVKIFPSEMNNESETYQVKCVDVIKNLIGSEQRISN